MSSAEKLDSEWNDEIGLGQAGTSTEVYIVTATGAMKANDIRLANGSPYCMDDIQNFHKSMREYVEGSPCEDTISLQETEPTMAQAPEPMFTRGMRLNPDDFVAHGYTKDCAGCYALQTEAAARRRRNHAEACRICIEKLLTARPAGQERKRSELERSV